MTNESQELPAGWLATTIGNVCNEPVDQRGPSNQEGDFIYVDISSVDNQQKRVLNPKRLLVAEAPARARNRLVHGDVLVSMTRPNLNAVALVPKDLENSIASTGFDVLRTRGIDPRWIFYLVQTRAFTEALSRVVQGALYPAVRPRDIRAYEIPLAPLKEQIRIIGEIEAHFSRLDTASDSLSRAKDNLKRYRASMLKAAYTTQMQGVANNGTRFKIRRLPMRSLISTLDQGWSPRCERHPSADSRSWGVLKTTAVQPLSFRGTENKELPADLVPRAHLEIRPNDVLITRAGPRSRVGVSCCVDVTRERLILSDKMYRLRTDRDVIRPVFLSMMLNSPEVLEQLDEMKTGISDSGVNLTQDRFLELELPVPPLPVQERIEKFLQRMLSVADNVELSLEAEVLRASHLRQSILKRAFQGKLVPQDPNDESASALLERIHASGVEQKAASKPRRARRKAGAGAD